jgi:hypothetical protein
MIKLLPSVSLKGLTPQMSAALPIVGGVYGKHDVDCVCTCGSNGKHSRTSLHYSGNALDFRTKHLDPSLKATILSEVQQALSAEFDVLLEDMRGPNEHLHVEWQPKG